MKIKELKELKTMKAQELRDLVSKKKLELLQNEVKIRNTKEKNLKVLWKLRKEIAQVLSVLNSLETK